MTGVTAENPVLSVNEPESPGARCGWRRAGLAVAAACLLTGLWCIGFGWFLTSPDFVTIRLPANRAHPPGLHNLVAFELGPTIIASSYFNNEVTQCHPAFVTDGRPQPTPLEKWSSGLADRAPWLELRWSGSRRVSSVGIQHAGLVESANLTARDYRLTCLQRRGNGPTVMIEGNETPVVRHALDCEDAVGLRVDFRHPRGGEPIRIYEVEVWGQ